MHLQGCTVCTEISSVSAGTWLVEAITGKGLHSAGQDAKLLPAVKQHLAKKDITFWELPGMVVFKLSPSPDDLY